MPLQIGFWSQIITFLTLLKQNISHLFVQFYHVSGQNYYFLSNYTIIWTEIFIMLAYFYIFPRYLFMLIIFSTHFRWLTDNHSPNLYDIYILPYPLWLAKITNNFTYINYLITMFKLFSIYSVYHLKSCTLWVCKSIAWHQIAVQNLIVRAISLKNKICDKSTKNFANKRIKSTYSLKFLRINLIFTKIFANTNVGAFAMAVYSIAVTPQSTFFYLRVEPNILGI